MNKIQLTINKKTFNIVLNTLDYIKQNYDDKYKRDANILMNVFKENSVIIKRYYSGKKQDYVKINLYVNEIESLIFLLSAVNMCFLLDNGVKLQNFLDYEVYEEDMEQDIPSMFENQHFVINLKLNKKILNIFLNLFNFNMMNFEKKTQINADFLFNSFLLQTQEQSHNVLSIKLVSEDLHNLLFQFNTINYYFFKKENVDKIDYFTELKGEIKN